MNLNLKLAIALTIVSIVVSGIIYVRYGEKEESGLKEFNEATFETDSEQSLEYNNSQTAQNTTANLYTNSKKIYVYIVGQVVSPGVYELEHEARVYEAIELAGGFTNQAAITTVNMAKKLSDGEQIYVYSFEQLESSGADIYEAASSKKININSAKIEELTTLPGIGESRAKCIIDYRNNQGIFDTIEDIMKVSGIKEGAFAKIKDYITV